MAASSIAAAVSQTVAFLVRPLSLSYPPSVVSDLATRLEANLAQCFAPSWFPLDPLQGAEERCLTLSPNCIPPRVIYSACIASGVQWFDWMKCLGGAEFDLSVNPGCVSVRVGSKITTIWSSQPQSTSRGYAKTSHLTQFDRRETDELFVRIADEVNPPSWATSPMSPYSVRSSSPLSAMSSSDESYSAHSRCSSRSSYSAYSSECSTSPGSTHSKMSRREKARQARVIVDTTKTAVTPYDGGKTTVLTGGVMLGGGSLPPPPPTARPRHAHQGSISFRVSASPYN